MKKSLIIACSVMLAASTGLWAKTQKKCSVRDRFTTALRDIPGLRKIYMINAPYIFQPGNQPYQHRPCMEFYFLP